MNQLSSSSSIYSKYYHLTSIIQICIVYNFVLFQKVEHVAAKVDCAKECPCGLPPLEVPDQFLEAHVVGSFKVWHIIFIIIALIVIITIVYCCFHRCRIPRTKQEIEADSKRSDLAKKFRLHLQELPVEQTSTLIEALRKVQELEEIKSEQENEDGGGARKRLGWLKMLGKVETINKEDGDTVDLEKQLKDRAAEEEKNRLLAALSDPKNLTHLSKVESKDTEKLISAVADADRESNHQHHQADPSNDDMSNHGTKAKDEIEANDEHHRSRTPEDSSSVKELRLKKGRGEKLNKAEKKRLDQADKDIKKARKEAEKLAKLENKLHMERELKARKEAKEKERLDLIELRRKEKEDKIEQERRLKEEKKGAKRSAKLGTNAKLKEDQIKDKSIESPGKNSKDISPNSHESTRGKSNGKTGARETSRHKNTNSKATTVNIYNGDKAKKRNKKADHNVIEHPNKKREKHHKSPLKEENKSGEVAHHKHDRDERSRSKKREQEDSKPNISRDSSRNNLSPRDGKHHHKQSGSQVSKEQSHRNNQSSSNIKHHKDREPQIDRKSKQEEVRRILNLPSLAVPHSPNTQADTKSDLEDTNFKEANRVRHRSHVPRSKSHHHDGSEIERSIRNVKPDQVQSLNRDTRSTPRSHHHSDHIHHQLRPQQQSNQLKEKLKTSELDIQKDDKEEVVVVPLNISELSTEEIKTEYHEPIVTEPNSNHLERPQTDPVIIRMVSPTRLSKMVGRRLILDAVTTRKDVLGQPFKGASTSSGGGHHIRHQLRANRGDRSRLRKTVPAKNSQDDVTIEITNPEMREIYETRIEMDQLRDVSRKRDDKKQ